MVKKMEFRDLKRQYQVLKNEIDSAMLGVAQRGTFISGPEVEMLEKELATAVGVKHCISCGNGTDALSMMLMAWDVKEGDAVFVPDFTFFASGEVVSFEGATPIFVDVNPDTFNMDPQKLDEAIKSVKAKGKLTPKAVIGVDLFGLPADYRELEEICKRYDILLLEDGAQGFGGRIGTRQACSFGNAATTSFFPAKPVGCYGDGGAIFTNSDETASYLRSIRVHGKGDYKYDNVRIGWNSRLDTIQAAILMVKLKAFQESELAAVNKAASIYTKKLQGIVKTPVIPGDMFSSWAQYTITLDTEKQRDALQQALKEKGIPTMVYYPKPMHLQKAFSDLDGKAGDFPITEALCGQVLALPMHPYLKEEEIETVCNAVKIFLNK